jgi:hypothetical protein
MAAVPERRRSEPPRLSANRSLTQFAVIAATGTDRSGSELVAAMRPGTAAESYVTLSDVC